MKGYRAVRRAITALRRNPMRAMLTALGIIIGVAAVIAMMEIGAGSSSAIQKSICYHGCQCPEFEPRCRLQRGRDLRIGQQHHPHARQTARRSCGNALRSVTWPPLSTHGPR